MHSKIYASGDKPVDSVRAVFWEGDELYPTAGFKEKNHVQLCIRNPNAIKDYFIHAVIVDRQVSVPSIFGDHNRKYSETTVCSALTIRQ